MSAGAIIFIAIAAAGILMMRFRKRWLAKINIAITNRITGLFAIGSSWLDGRRARQHDVAKPPQPSTRSCDEFAE